jgi:DNA-binding transcriptional regulator GbsR (MarR family)
MIQIVDDNNNALYSLNEISEILGVSKSTARRYMLRENFSQELDYNGQFLFSEKSVFQMMENLIEKKMKRQND